MYRTGAFPVAACTAVLALTACSSGSGGSSSSSGISDAPSSPMTSTVAVGAPPGAKVLGAPGVGQPFTITVTYSNDAQPSKFKLTVTGVVCGQGLDPAVLAYAASSIGESSSPSPTPGPGTEYCVMSMDAVNVGNAAANWNADNTVSLNVGAVEYSETSQDQEFALDYEQYWYSKGQVGPTFGINPGVEGPVHGVFEIPAGATPTSLWVAVGGAITTMDGVEPGYLVKL